MADVEMEIMDDEESEEEESFTTPSDIALATGADPKRVRAHLRARYPRALKLKNTRWEIPDEIAAKVIEHFEAGGDEVEEDELDEVLNDE